MATAAGVNAPACIANACHLPTNSDGTAPHPDTKEVLDLTREYDHRDPAGESGGDGTRDELDCGSQLGDPHANEDDTSHERRHGESIDPVLLDDAVDDHDERTRWTSYLDARAAKSGDDEPRDDRGPETSVRRNAAGNGECYGERERNDPNDHPSRQIAKELITVVRFEGSNELWN